MTTQRAIPREFRHNLNFGKLETGNARRFHWLQPLLIDAFAWSPQEIWEDCLGDPTNSENSLGLVTGAVHI